MKILSIIVLVLLSSLCFSGDDKMIHNSDERVSQLKKMLVKEKFNADRSLFYPGAPTEDVRTVCEQAMNITIQALIETPKSGITEEDFWLLLENASKVYKQFDSEEMDRGLTYMEEIMDIYSIESSGGRLNNWRYGFDPSVSR